MQEPIIDHDRRHLDGSNHHPLPPLDVALVTETYPPEINGVAMTLANLVGGLRTRGWRVQVVRPRQSCDNGSCDENEWLRPSLPIPNYAGLRLGLPSGFSLHGRWRRKRPDLVHVVTEGPLGLSALRSARRLGIPVSSGFHTNFHDYTRHYGVSWMHGALERYLKAFHNRTRCTLVPAEDVITQLAKRGFRNLMLLGRGVDAGLFSPELRSQELRASWGAAPDTLVALHVGRVAPEKN
ncbi:MAG: glycosyltransferase, partial [Planctomycetes bacterium]|nr:glycosyltransferase [Planctomycetota bacterium]